MHLYISEAIRVTLATFVVRCTGGFCGRTHMDRPIFTAFAVGVALGDIQTGLKCAAAVEGMFVGVAHVGTMVTDYTLAAIIVTAMTIINKSSAEDYEATLALAVPVATFGVAWMNISRPLFALWYPVLTKYAEKGDWAGVRRVRWIKMVVGWIPSLFPVFLFVAFGPDSVQAILDHLPAIVMKTAGAAGGLMTGFGLSLCMNQLWDNKFCGWWFFGFVLAKYAGLPVVSILVISIAIGIAYAQLMDAGTGKSAAANEEEELFA